MDFTDADWNFTEAIGGRDRLDAIVTDFYERVFDDPIIGFMFADTDLDEIVDSQVEYLRARLGSEDVEYTGEPIRPAHDDLPIQVGHFDRRHTLLQEVLADYGMPDEIREAWLELDRSLRDLVLRTGEEARQSMIHGEDASDDS